MTQWMLLLQMNKDVNTPNHKFPLTVAKKSKWLNLRVLYTFENIFGQQFETDWMWDMETCASTNNKLIEDVLIRAENATNLKAISNAQAQLYAVRESEARIHALFHKSF